MSPRPIRLIATDLDGTLLRSDGSLSSRVRGSLLGAHEAGLEVVPATGRPRMITEDVIAWLSCESLPPLALGPLRKVTLGRSRDCDLILPHKTVSRVHGEIRVDGAKILYEDSSSYGSLINGRTAIGVMELEVGDTLSIGPYDVHVRPAGPKSPSEPSEESIEPMMSL